jgi:cell division protein FtsL
MSVTELVGPALKPRPPEVPRHLRLVGVEELAAIRRRRRFRIGGMVVAAFVILLLFAAVGMHVLLAQNQFRLDQLNTAANAQQAQYQQLQLQVDQLSSPQRILSIAEGKLGMVEPKSVTYLDPSSATSGPSATANQGGPAPATAPAGWSSVKSQLAAANP